MKQHLFSPFRTDKNKLPAALLLSACLAAFPAQAGGIPTIDGASLAQNIQRGLQMAEQIKNQEKQIKEMKKQVEAFKGGRNMGNLLRNAAQEQLPEEWKAVYNAAAKMNNKDLLSSKGYKDGASADHMLKQFDLLMRAIKDSEIRMKNINALMDQIDSTQDIKAAADLQNRIAAEQAHIQQNQTNLDMMARMMDLQEKVLEKKSAAYENCLRKHRNDPNTRACE